MRDEELESQSFHLVDFFSREIFLCLKMQHRKVSGRAIFFFSRRAPGWRLFSGDVLDVL